MPRKPLPARLRRFFWQHRASRLDLSRDRDLIIRTLLVEGDWSAHQWLRREVGDDALRTWILDHEGRGLDRRDLRFWELVLKLPHARVNRWIGRIRDLPWERRTELLPRT